MKPIQKAMLLAGCLAAALVGGSAFGGTLIISDNYNVTTAGNGFALGSGVNDGINPPTTRLTGTAATGLRYIKTAGAKTDAAHYITNSTKFGIARVSTDSSTVSLSSGSGAYDFGPALNVLAASPDQPASYDLTIKIANAASGNQRCSFALSSAAGTAGAWDFAIQLYHAATGDAAYTLQKRISANACGGTALNSVITTVGTYAKEVSFLIRVTDAGAEAATFSSHVQVSIDGGATWIYDSSTDPELTSGFRFPGSSRFIYWDIAGGAGPVTYDDFTVTWNSGPTSAPRVWSGGGADNNWTTSANWGGVAPGAGDPLIFAGTTRPVNTNDFPGLLTPSLTLNNGGFALYGNVWTNTGAITNLAGTNLLGTDVAWSGVAAKSWLLAGGSELQLTATNYIEVNGDHNLYGGGTLHQKGTIGIGQLSTANPAFVLNEGQHLIDGGTFASRGGYRIGSLGASTVGAQTILTNGAFMNLTTSGANLRLGDSSNAVTSRLVVDHSSLSMAGSHLYVAYAAGATSVVSQVGGTISGCQLNFGSGGAAVGAYTNSGGTLEAYVVNEGASGVYSYAYFDNAVLRVLNGATNAFMSGLNRAEVQSGGLTIDAQGDAVIAQNLVGAGNLTKTGYGTLTLSGNLTYTGNTFVNLGRLTMPTGKTYAGQIQVADNAEFGVTVASLGAGLTNGTLVLGTSSFSTLNFDLGTSGDPTAPLLSVTNLTANGFVTINVANGFQLQPGTIVLVDYTGSIGGGGFGAFLLGNLPPGVSAHLVNNTANSSIDLSITAVPGYIWKGTVNGEWDFSTQNWFDQQSGSASAYSDGYLTMFLDGAATNNVNLDIFPSPSAIIVTNNALPYVWSGSALITPLIKKYGTNAVIRVGGEGDTITSIELNEGAYVLSNAYDATLTTVLTDVSAGTGTFVKDGPSQLTVTSTNSSYNGTFAIQNGSVKMGNDRALGASSGKVTIANGATLDLNNKVPGDMPVTVSGAGVSGVGAIIDSTTGTGVDVNLRDVTLVGDTTFGSSGRWDLRARSSTGPAPGLRGNGYSLTKVGPGSVSIANQRTTTGYWHMNLGDVFIREGTLTFAESLTPDNPTAALAIYPGAIFNVYDLGLTNPLLRNITMTNAQISCGGNAGDTNLLNGNILLSGDNRIFADSAQLIINGAISGNGTLSFSANSPGTLTLNGVNTYTGDTSITNGTLAGNGTVPGNLIMYGGTNAPGWDGVGTLTVNGNVTLGGTTRMELDRSRSPNSDRLVVGGTLSFGGILQVVLGAGAPAPQAGDIYQLFSKGSASAFSAISLPDLSALPGGLGWDTSKLSVDGTLKVTGTATPPVISSVARSGNALVFSGTNGVQGNTYYVLNATNLAAPLNQWVRVATNTFGPGGAFSVTNTVNAGQPASFFRLQLP